MDITKTESNIGAGVGESERNGTAETAGCAGDERDLPGEIKSGEVHADSWLS